jgi:hypothetical protein
MSSAMPLDTPPKLIVDEFVGAAIANTPEELHPHFEQFGALYKKK